MCDRPAVLVRIEDHDGAFGWGEIWANWPAAGAEHRVRLLEMDIAPLLVGTRAQRPEDFFHRLEQQTQIRATQCGEIGPFNQVIAGLDRTMGHGGAPFRTALAALYQRHHHKSGDCLCQRHSSRRSRRSFAARPDRRASDLQTEGWL